MDAFVVCNCEISENGIVCCELSFCGCVVSRETKELTRYVDIWKLYYVYHGFNIGVPRFTFYD